MKNESYVAACVTAAAISCIGVSMAAEPRPNPVKSCEDVRAYIDTDNSMTMDTFKSLLTAAGADLSTGGGHSLDLQCKVTAVVKHVVMSQSILKKADGSVIGVSTEVVTDNGVCKLVNISLTGC
jgi:hypothetical protein